MLLSILYLLLLKVTSISSLSGLYTDNGFDQTALHHEMTLDDQNSMKHDILELLGLPNRPKEQNQQISLRKSAPQFLIDIYNHLTSDRTSRVKRSLTENEFEQRNVEESDVIMSFMNKKHHRSDLLFFDVSKISSEVFLMNSELRIYKSGGNQDFLLKIFSVNQQLKLREISSVNVSASHHGWIHLNVTEGLLQWIENSNENRGLFIKAQSPTENNLESYGIVTSKIDDEEHQPFIVGFFKGQEKVTLQKHRRSKRAAPKRTQLQVTNPFFPSMPVPSSEKACSIQTLFVNFKDLKWHDWIIAPEGFGAFYCSGECNFPLNSNMNATNHAIIQTLVHLLHPHQVPKPCCAPTNLGPVSVLYYLDDTNVNLKKYKNMVVESCGCH